VGESNIDGLEKRVLVNKDKNMNVTVHDVILTIGHQMTKETRFRFESAHEIEKCLKKVPNLLTCKNCIARNLFPNNVCL